MESEKLIGPAESGASHLPHVGRTEPTPPIAAKHKYFVGKFSGEYPSIADAISDAGLPPDAKAMGELPALPGPSKILAFQAPRGTSDAEDDLLILIVEPLADGKVNLWLSGTDLAREQREEAEEDVDNYVEITGDAFHIFERL